MSKLLDIPFNEGKKQGIAEARAKVNKQKIMRMIDLGYSKEQILTLFSEAGEDLYNKCKEDHESIKMSDIFDYVFNQGKKEGLKEGRVKYCEEQIKKMIDLNYSNKEIAQLFGDEKLKLC